MPPRRHAQSARHFRCDPTAHAGVVLDGEICPSCTVRFATPRWRAARPPRCTPAPSGCSPARHRTSRDIRFATPPSRGTGNRSREAATLNPGRDQHSRVPLGTECMYLRQHAPIATTATGCCQDRLHRVTPWPQSPAHELAGPSTTTSWPPGPPDTPVGGSRLLRPTRPVVAWPEIHPNDGRRNRVCTRAIGWSTNHGHSSRRRWDADRTKPGSIALGRSAA